MGVDGGWSADDITPLDAAAFIAREPQYYFLGGRASADFVALTVAGNALVLGAAEVIVEKADGWITVRASQDWLHSLGDEAFDSLALVALGVNASNAVAAAVHLADGVTTATPDGSRIVKGSLPGPFTGPLRAPWQRAVSFHGLQDQS